jgi:hypothetical protein
MVERFNGRIEEVLQSHHFRSSDELGATLHRYVWLYNQPASAISLRQQNALASHETMAQNQTELFKKQPYYLTGCDS